MRTKLPDPKEILEELVDRAALQIDRRAPVSFDAALDELTRYHRFLLSIYASQLPNGKPFNYAAVPGEAWRAPHNEWISQYRRLFERAANRIGDDTDFIEKLAYAPLRLLPSSTDPRMADEVLVAIVDLGRILIHQLEAWFTKRTVVETTSNSAAKPRLALAGSDARSYSNLLPSVVGAWESLLQMAPNIYRWRDDPKQPQDERWASLRESWPFLWQHLRNTAYMLAVSVWNEDESGAKLFRDALVRWPQALSHHFNDHSYFPERQLLFPDILTCELTAARERVKPILPQFMPTPSPDELFKTALTGAHNDVLLLTAALLLSWSTYQKQVSDIGARTASALLRREVEDKDEETNELGGDMSSDSLVMDIVRLEIADDQASDTNYGGMLDKLVESLDNMTERRVVPGRIFAPSTLHDRRELRLPLLAMLLAGAPEKDNALVNRIRWLARNEPALPHGDRSLRDIVQGADRFQKMLETPPPALERGLTLLGFEGDRAEASARVASIITASVQAIEAERTARLREQAIDCKIICDIGDAAEHSMISPPGGVPFFRGFAIETTPGHEDGQVYKCSLDGLSKAQFVDPPMESGALRPSDIAQFVTEAAGEHAWGQFTLQPRENVTVPSRIEEPDFWNRVKVLAADVGAEPLLIISRSAEGRTLKKLIFRQGNASPLTIERKSNSVARDGYIATIEGIDVHGADFPPGKAWLFSPYLLQSLQYPTTDEDRHFVRVSFQPGEDLTGPLVIEFKQHVVWSDWPIYEINCEDPDEPETL